MKFYFCKTCKNIIYYVSDEHVPVMCCGEAMKELMPNTVDAAYEKHVPLIKENGKEVTVYIGSIPHPMTAEHYIMWIALETTEGAYFKYLSPNDEPKAIFNLNDNEHVISAYEYCNIHGLWKK